MKISIYKRLLILIVYICTVAINSGYSQYEDWLWAKSGGGSSKDQGTGVAIDSMGNVYTVGLFRSNNLSFGTYNLVNNGAEDMFVVKHSRLGSVIWAKSAGGSSYDPAYCVTTDGYGNVYVAGYFASNNITFGTITLTKSGVRNLFVVKYSSTGNVLWAKKAEGNIVPSKITADKDGNILLTGNFSSSTINFGIYTLSNKGGEDIFIVKYNSSGTVIWAKDAGGIASDQASGIATDPTGNVFITGAFSSNNISFGSISLTNAGLQDVFIVKFTPNGNVIWAKRAGGSNPDFAYGTAADDSGFVYVVGEYSSNAISFGNNTLWNNGDYDIFITKYNSTGSVIWAKGIGKSGLDRAVSVTVDFLYNVYIVGLYASSSITFDAVTLTNTGLQDIFVIKYNSAGVLQWAKSAGGPFFDHAKDIAVDRGENAYISGYFNSSSITFGNDVLSNNGNHDIFLAKVGRITTTFDVTHVTCFGDSTGSIDFEVSGGNSPYTFNWSTGDTTEDLQNIKTGTYYITVTDSVGRLVIDSVIITSPPPLVLITVSTNLKCNGDSNGSIDLNVSGGTPSYNYFWSNGDTTEDLDSLNAGIYLITVTDSNSCFSKDTIIISQPNPLNLTFTAKNASHFEGKDGSIDLSISGGTTPYYYDWSTSDTSEDLDSLQAGTYYITITDSNNCSVEDTISITEPPELLISYKKVDASCFGYTDGSIDLIVSGGIPPYLFNWSNWETTEDIKNLSAGTYIIIVTDSNFFSLSDTITIDQPSALSASYLKNSVNCNKDTNGWINLTTTGGTVPFKYSWSTGDSIKDLANISAGSYIVNIIDSHNCTYTDTITIDGPPPVKAVFMISSKETQCLNENEFVYYNMTDTVSQSQEFRWEFGDDQNSSVYSVKHKYSFIGVYQVKLIAKSANNCRDTSRKTVTVIENPIAGFDTISDRCLMSVSFLNSSFNAEKYYWDFGDGKIGRVENPTYGYAKPGFYKVTLRARNENCSDTATMTIRIDSLKSNLFIPNAFSPNNDGINDTFKVEGWDYECGVPIKIIIFNKWGEIIFESEYGKPEWDGRYKGKYVIPGMYYYMVLGEHVSEGGSVMILR